MSEEQATNGANGAAPAPTGAQFSVEKIYVKDVSFESPARRRSSTSRASRSST